MRLVRLIAIGGAVVFLGGALPSVAAATDYCVAPNPSCDPANTYETLELALGKADDAADADRVFLTEGTYVAQTPDGFHYGSPTAPVEIIGAGRGRTILTNKPGTVGEVLFLVGGPGTSVHDLTIRIPAQVGDGFFGLGTRNVARHIEVVENPDQINERTGVVLTGGGTLADSSVTLGKESGGVWLAGAQLGYGTNVVRDSMVSADNGVFSESGGTVERSRVAGSPAIQANSGHTAIASSLLRITRAGGDGILAGSAPGGTTMDVDGATVVGPSGGSSDGVRVTTLGSPDTDVHVNLTNSIVRTTSPLLAYATGLGQATISASYSDYDSTGNQPTGTGKISESNIGSVGDAGFADAAGGDYRLLAGSPLVDAGDPGTPQGLDLSGSPLVADGNGDGSARRDLGAFELQPPQPQPVPAPGADMLAPRISGFRAEPAVFAVARAATPRSARVARGTRLRFTLSEGARVTLKVKRFVAGRPTRYRATGTLRRNAVSGLNRVRFSGRIGRRALRPGRYRVVMRAVDAAGNRSARKAAGFRVVR